MNCLMYQKIINLVVDQSQCDKYYLRTDDSLTFIGILESRSGSLSPILEEE